MHVVRNAEAKPACLTVPLVTVRFRDLNTLLLIASRIGTRPSIEVAWLRIPALVTYAKRSELPLNILHKYIGQFAHDTTLTCQACLSQESALKFKNTVITLNPRYRFIPMI